MSNRNYDSSAMSQRRQNKTVASNFIIRQSLLSQQSFGVIPGNYDASVIEQVYSGQIGDVKRGTTGYCVDKGCPCISLVPTTVNTGSPPIIPPNFSPIYPPNTSVNIPTSPTLVWPAVPTATSYQVLFGTNPLALTLYGTTPTTSITVPNLLDLTLYYWQIIPTNAYGPAVNSPIWSFTTDPPPLPNCTTPIMPLDGASNVPINSPIQWNASLYAEEYDIYFGTSSTPSQIGSTLGLTYNPTSVDYNQVYYWQIVPTNVSGAAINCPVWSFTTELPPLPECPQLISPTDTQTNISVTPTFTWTSVQYAASYKVYLGTSPNPPLVATVAATASPIESYTVGPTLLFYNTTYYWQIVPSNVTGDAIGCITQSFTTEPHTQNNGKARWAVNPFSNITSGEAYLYNSVAASDGTTYSVGYYTMNGDNLQDGLTTSPWQATSASPTVTVSAITNPTPPNVVGFAYLAKYNSSGEVMAAVSFGNTPSSVTNNNIAYSVAVSSNGQDIYVTGQLLLGGSAIDLPNYNPLTGSQVSSGVTIPAVNTADAIFLVKYNANLQVQWATMTRRATASTADLSSGFYVAVDSSNNVYVTGRYRSSGGNPIRLYNARLTANPSPPVNSYTWQDLTTYTLLASSSIDTFLIKYNSSGQIQGATVIVSNSSPDRGVSLAFDSSNNVYVGGIYASTTVPTPPATSSVYNFNGTTGQSTTTITFPVTSSGNTAIFLVKYNANLIAQSATTFNGTSSTDVDKLTSVYIRNNNVYITGTYISTPNSNYIALYNGVSTGSTNNPAALSGKTLAPTITSTTTTSAGFLIKYDTILVVQWATIINYPFDSERNNAVSVDSLGNVYVTGYRAGGNDSYIIYDANAVENLSPLPPATYSWQTENQTLAVQLPQTGNLAYLVKYTTNGIAQWATYLNLLTTTTDIPYTVTIDQDNYVYWGGVYNNSTPPTTIPVIDAGTPGAGAGGTQPAAAPNGMTLPTTNSTWKSFLIRYE